MKKIWCPGCDQGWVVPVRIKATGQLLYICEECETTWFSEDGVGRDTPANFTNYMESIGLKGLWSELDELPTEVADEQSGPG